MTFHSVLIANRGEIACRIIRAAREMGYRTVAVFSEADRDSLHVRLADTAVPIGPAPVAQSYLDARRLIEAARTSGADAVHPGYGFLSEKAEFAELCAASGLVFIGPSAEAIRLMGDKAQAKRRMIEAGVPCVPGYQGADQSDARIASEAARIGYPVMIKAAAGGGGRGMRLVAEEGGLNAALQAARAEAGSAFGDETVLLERAISEPRHVEIQVFGDSRGTIVHLGERDCSIQRRYQKIIEESPSPALTPAVRAQMGAAAVAAARAINYVGAGTVEFLLGPDGAFYFMEMNTRLQVEHPVTECVTGVDLVALQLDVAAGKPLGFGQDDVRLTGHAIEARLYAENESFLPQTGTVHVWERACGPGLRVDHGLSPGAAVTSHYDPMLAKIIAWGADREEARRRLLHAIADTTVLGVTTNKPFLLRALSQPAFVAGEATTGFIDRHMPAVPPAEDEPEDAALAAVLLVDRAGGAWRSSAWRAHPVLLAASGGTLALTITRDGADWAVSMDGQQTCRIALLERDGARVRYARDGGLHTAPYAIDDGTVFLDRGAGAAAFRDVTYAPAAAGDGGAGDGVVRAPMSGLVIGVRVVGGQRVERGDVVAVLEAMKMQMSVTSAVTGTVARVAVAPGQQVRAQETLATVTPDENPEVSRPRIDGPDL